MQGTIDNHPLSSHHQWRFACAATGTLRKPSSKRDVDEVGTAIIAPDSERHGCRDEAYMDVFTARPAR